MEHYYHVHVKWEQERKGLMCSPELEQHAGKCIEVATPPEFPKGIPGIWSPEHLFVASVSSCFMTTFLAIAENSKLEFFSFECPAKGKLAQQDGKYMITEVLLEPRVTILHEKDYERTQRILQKTESACLITHSIKSRVITRSTIQVATEAQ
ncbi:MAG: hypothetical protein KatS3mg031_0470 [Chitinophagales bacterium]|nr:MAG: hypothetical protein KatS3mg031_0470 [Chitinophagales bacterium]